MDRWRGRPNRSRPCRAAALLRICRRGKALSRGDIASEAIVQVEHSVPPQIERVGTVKYVLRARHAHPLQNGKKDVVGISRRGAAYECLALEGRLHRLERAAQALERLRPPRPRF